MKSITNVVVEKETGKNCQQSELISFMLSYWNVRINCEKEDTLTWEFLLSGSKTKDRNDKE